MNPATATTAASTTAITFDPNLFTNLLSNTVDGGFQFITSLGDILKKGITNMKDIHRWRNQMIYQYGQDNNMDTVIDVVIQRLKNKDPADLSQLEMLVHIVNKRKIFNEVDEFLSQITNHTPPLTQESYNPVYKGKPLGSVQYSVHKNKIKENNALIEPKDKDYNLVKTGVTNLVRVQTPFRTISEQIKDVENLFESIDMERKERGETKETVHRDSIRIQNGLLYKQEVDPEVKPKTKTV